MKTIALMMAVIAVFAIFMAMRSKSRTTTRTTVSRSKTTLASKGAAAAPKHSYKATSIVFEDSACEAVKAIGKKRFLDRDRDVPILPLADCTVAQCNCTYAHHDDRRDSSDDRRHPSGLQSELYDASGQANRRQKKRGRRKSDWA